MAALIKALQEFAASAAQEPADAGTSETPAQLTEQAADATLPGICGPALSEAAKNLSDLVPVLIARDREQPRRAVIDGKPRLIALLLR